MGWKPKGRLHHIADSFEVAPAVSYQNIETTLRSAAYGSVVTGKRCAHRQAEPVILSTGETVACICIECLDALSPDWITNQRDRAHRIATCPHRNTVELAELSNPDPEHICTACGVTATERQLKDDEGRYLLIPPSPLSRGGAWRRRAP